MSWIKTSEQLPDYGKDTLLFVVYKGERMIRSWNAYYKSWDDEDMDDHFCTALEVSHWQPLPELPKD